MTFVNEGEKVKNKVLKNYIKVRVVIDVECVDTNK